MARRKKINRRLRARQTEIMAIVSLPGVDDRVKLARGVPGWGGRRGLVLAQGRANGATWLKVRLDNSGPVVTVLASETMLEAMLGGELRPVETGSLWDVGASCFAAPDARWS